MIKKLRLLLFNECHKSCEWCCNNDWDLNSLSTKYNYNEYQEILITGGEPLIKPKLTLSVIKKIRSQSNAKIFVYTAFPGTKYAMDVLKLADGLTITLHDQHDVKGLIRFVKNITEDLLVNKSLRLNIFKGVKITNKNILKYFTVKDNIEWIKNCPLPVNEVFRKYKE